MVAALAIAQALFMLLGYPWGVGLLYGILVSVVVGSFSLETYRKSFQTTPQEGSTSKWSAAFPSLVKYLVYGLALAAATATPHISFFATAGGLLLPRFVLQLYVLVTQPSMGG